MEKNNFDLYIEKYKACDKSDKKSILFEELKVLALLANQMCVNLGVESQLFLNKELSDLKDNNYSEDDYYEALMVLICSIENSLADFNNGLTDLFDEIEKNS